MGFLVSPGVEVNEIDMTNSIPALSTSIGAYAGQFRWGPIEQITTIGSETELAKTFGAPNDNGENARSYFTAASFLQYGSALKVVRAYDPAAENAYSDSALAGGPIKSYDDFHNASPSAGFYAKYPGAIANNIQVILVTEANDNDLIYGGYSGAQSTAYSKLLTYSPSTTTFAKTVSGVDVLDEVSVLIIDGDGQFSGTKGKVLEIFEGLSFATNAKTTDGANNYIGDVLNDRSRYVFASDIETLVLQTANTTITSATVPFTYKANAKFEYTLSHGDDGAVNDSDVVVALDLFGDAETVDISFLFAQNFAEGDQVPVDEAVLSISYSRKDVIGFVSAPLSLATSNISDSPSVKAGLVIAKFAEYTSTSYAVFDSTPVQTYNKYADRYIWIPACGHMAGLCANADAVADPWFSPGGYTRGQLRGVSKLAFNPAVAFRDELYKARVNPIVSFPGQGIVLYGDKTALSKPSAFDRINVRRLFIVLEKAIATFSKFQLFELNDEFTRSAFRAAVEPYLRNVQARRGITDFRVICDTSNNTGDVIDGNRFVADIYIKPSRSINFITLNFIATRSGVEFKELVGG
jgi:hypothetical protein